MPFENDPEGFKIACSYAGRNFATANIVRHELLREYDGVWEPDEFLSMITKAIESIPPEYRSSAKVEMYDPGDDCSTSLQVYYEGPESAETVADRVRRCEEYVKQRREEERLTYDRLKAKFG